MRDCPYSPASPLSTEDRTHILVGGLAERRPHKRSRSSLGSRANRVVTVIPPIPCNLIQSTLSVKFYLQTSLNRANNSVIVSANVSFAQCQFHNDDRLYVVCYRDSLFNGREASTLIASSVIRWVVPQKKGGRSVLRLRWWSHRMTCVYRPLVIRRLLSPSS